MADNESNAAAGGPESTRKPKAEAPKTKSYVLKEGASINTIEDGNHVTRVGAADGQTSVRLTQAQAEAFSDKLDLKATPVDVGDDAQTIVVGMETGAGNTIPEGAALAAAAAGITGDSEGDDHEGADAPKPAGPHSDVHKMPAGTKSQATSATPADNVGAGQTSKPSAGDAQAKPAARAEGANKA